MKALKELLTAIIVLAFFGIPGLVFVTIKEGFLFAVGCFFLVFAVTLLMAFAIDRMERK